MVSYSNGSTAFALKQQKDIEESYEMLEKYGLHVKSPDFYAAETLNEALSLLAEIEGSKIIAGGMDMMDLMRNTICQPSALISIRNIPQLSHIMNVVVGEERGLDIGSMTKVNTIAESKEIIKKYPLLAQAALHIGSPQIRNMISAAGNLCQQTHCWYYRRSPSTGLTFDCIRNGKGNTCHAKDGENENHAIFCSGKCHSANHSDLAVAFTALDAKLKVSSDAGKRWISMDKFYTNLGNSLKQDEIITGIMIPEAEENTRQQYIKVASRQSIDIAIASVASSIVMDGERVKSARIVLGGVADKPYRALKAEEMLKGERITENIAEKAAKEVASDAEPLEGNEYKVNLLTTILKRAILA